MKSRKRAVRRFYDFVVGKREPKLSPYKKHLQEIGSMYDPIDDFHNEKLERIRKREMMNSIRNMED